MLTYPEVFTTPPDEVIYFYSVLQPKLLELEKNNKIVKLVQGFNSDLYLERNPSTHLAVVIQLTAVTQLTEVNQLAAVN